MEGEIRQRCFDYFKKYDIIKREDLRKIYKEAPLDGLNYQLVEGYFSLYKQQLKLQEKRKRKFGEVLKVVCVNDLHIPFHNYNALTSVFDFIVDFQPNELILNGDIMDFYALSNFDKDPGRRLVVQDEVDIFFNSFRSLRREIKETAITFIRGNHECRLERQIWNNPGFFGIRALELPKLLRLDELDMEYEPYHKIINGFEFTHGEVVRKHSSMSAKAEFETRNSSGMSGHTHRMGSFYKTSRDKSDGWFENGCLCGLDPEYVKGTPNWQNGFSVVYFDDNAFEVHPIFINNGRFRFNGKIYA